MSHKSAPPTVSTIGIDLGKNSFHLVGLDQRGAIVWQLKCSRAQLERRLANIPCCLIGMEACSGAHYIARQLAALGHGEFQPKFTPFHADRNITNSCPAPSGMELFELEGGARGWIGTRR
jgi:hypothetical protein